MSAPLKAPESPNKRVKMSQNAESLADHCNSVIAKMPAQNRYGSFPKPLAELDGPRTKILHADIYEEFEERDPNPGERDHWDERITECLRNMTLRRESMARDLCHAYEMRREPVVDGCRLQKVEVMEKQLGIQVSQEETKATEEELAIYQQEQAELDSGTQDGPSEINSCSLTLFPYDRDTIDQRVSTCVEVIKRRVTQCERDTAKAAEIRKIPIAEALRQVKIEALEKLLDISVECGIHTKALAEIYNFQMGRAGA